MTEHPIKDVVGVVDGDRLKWREHDLLSIFIRDRRAHHGALAEWADHDPVFMVGDLHPRASMITA